MILALKLLPHEMKMAYLGHMQMFAHTEEFKLKMKKEVISQNSPAHFMAGLLITKALSLAILKANSLEKSINLVTD